jgi:hypothetical protein
LTLNLGLNRVTQSPVTLALIYAAPQIWFWPQGREPWLALAFG